MDSGPQGPVVSGVSPNEGQPGTKLTIRGENLGDSLKDIMGVSSTKLCALVFMCCYGAHRHQDWRAQL